MRVLPFVVLLGAITAVAVEAQEVPTVARPVIVRPGSATAPAPVDHLRGYMARSGDIDSDRSLICSAYWPVTSDVLLRQLAAARLRWARMRPDRARYRVGIGGSMIAGPSFHIELRGDSVIRVRRDGHPAPVPSPAWLFERAEAAINGGADHVEIRFHSVYGLPMHVLEDRVRCVTDDATGVVVDRFVRLPRDR